MKVGLIGLGVIGSRVGARLAGAGILDGVYNRTQSRAEDFARAHEVEVFVDERGLVSACDTVLTVLSDDEAVLSVFNDLSGMEVHKKTFLDISTIAPSTSVKVADHIAKRGGSFLDCPIVGTAPMVEKGEATVLVGGRKEDFEMASPLLQKFAKEIVHVGPNGAGLRLKLVHNLVLASYIVALSESVQFGLAAGLEPAMIEKLLVSLSSIRSPNSAVKVPKILNSDYSTQFSLKHMIKDLGLIETEARLQKTPIPLGSLALQLYKIAEKRGFSNEDFVVVSELFKNSPSKSAKE